VFTVTLSQAIGTDVTFLFSTQDGTAQAPGDYAATNSATGRILAGTTQTNIAIAVHGDNTPEGVFEFFNLVLSSPSSNATIGNATGTCNIVDDDGVALLSVADTSVTEGNVGPTNAQFIVSINKASGTAVTFDYRTRDGTATVAGADYTSATGSGVIAAGAFQTTVEVAVAGDVWIESDETFELQVYNLANADPLDTNGICTILNDDYRLRGRAQAERTG